MSPAGCFSQTEHRGKERRRKRTRGEQGTGRSPGRYPARGVSLSILDSHGNGLENYIVVYIVYENIQHRELKVSRTCDAFQSVCAPGDFESRATCAICKRHVIL